jgi:outer membrane protein
MIKMKCKIFFLLSLLCFAANAQDLLTAEQAVAIALENNYDIKLSANDLRVDEQNVSLGNAGILPAVTGTFTRNNTIQNSTQVQSNGTVTELNNAENNNLNYGVNLGWTVFDGFRMFARYNQLQELRKLGETELKLTIVTRVSDVLSTYFDLVQQQQQLKALDTAIVLSQQRVTMAQNRFTIGKAARLEVLNAQVDLNTDQSNKLRQNETYQNTKTFLNELMARDLTAQFRVVDSVTIDNSLKLPDLMSLAGQQNPQIQVSLINKRVAELNLKQVRANRYPQIRLNTGYTISDTESSLGFARETSGKGFNYGVTASINVFNGFLQNRNERIAKIQIESSDLLIQQQSQAINSQLISAYQTYLTNLDLVALEQKNEDIARQNLDITMEKYRIGTITTLEVRTAQLNFVNAITRYSTARYQAKVSEVNLKELAGNITL